MWHLIKLTRPINLLIIAFTMYGLFFFGISHRPENYSVLLEITLAFKVDFFLLVFSTVLIAAGGNIINDYFDYKIDKINKPNKVLIGRFVHRRVAMLTHFLCNGIAVSIGAYLAFKYNTLLPLLFHLFTTSVLWFYSVILKRKFLIGNFSIAVLTAMVPVLTYLFTKHFFDPEQKGTYFLVSASFTVFAFIATLIREIVKDYADEVGDRTIGCKTLPIVLNRNKGNLVLAALFITLFILTIYFAFFYRNWFFTTVLQKIFFGSSLVILCVSFFQVWYAKTRGNWLLASTMIKISILFAVLYLYI